MADLKIHRRVKRYMQGIPADKKLLLKEKLQQLSEAPTEFRGAKPMKGNEWKGYYRIRSGDLRIIYFYDKETEVIYVDYIGPRGGIYKKH